MCASWSSRSPKRNTGDCDGADRRRRDLRWPDKSTESKQSECPLGRRATCKEIRRGRGYSRAGPARREKEDRGAKCPIFNGELRQAAIALCDLLNGLQANAEASGGFAGEIAPSKRPERFGAGVPHHKGKVAGCSDASGPQPAAALPLEGLNRIFQQIVQHQAHIGDGILPGLGQCDLEICLKPQDLGALQIMPLQGGDSPTLQLPDRWSGVWRIAEDSGSLRQGQILA